MTTKYAPSYEEFYAKQYDTAMGMAAWMYYDRFYAENRRKFLEESHKELLTSLSEALRLMDGDGGTPIGFRERANSAVRKATGGVE